MVHYWKVEEYLVYKREFSIYDQQSSTVPNINEKYQKWLSLKCKLYAKDLKIFVGRLLHKNEEILSSKEV